MATRARHSACLEGAQGLYGETTVATLNSATGVPTLRYDKKGENTTDHIVAIKKHARCKARQRWLLSPRDWRGREIRSCPPQVREDIGLAQADRIVVAERRSFGHAR